MRALLIGFGQLLELVYRFRSSEFVRSFIDKKSGLLLHQNLEIAYLGSRHWLWWRRRPRNVYRPSRPREHFKNPAMGLPRLRARWPFR